MIRPEKYNYLRAQYIFLKYNFVFLVKNGSHPFFFSIHLSISLYLLFFELWLKAGLFSLFVLQYIQSFNKTFNHDSFFINFMHNYS